MTPLNLKSVTRYVEKHIGEFHQSRLAKVQGLDLKEILRSKNPYLFKAKNVNRADEIIEPILSAHISSSEEGIFGNWLERLAIHICGLVYGGQKAGVQGIDLDFNANGTRYLVTIKSGPDWGNDSQVEKMIDHFDTARKRFKTSGGKIIVEFVNGCCYGRSRPVSEFKKKGGYYKICGQRFWELISGSPTLYTDLILPLGHDAKKKNDEFKLAYDALVNKMSKEFLNDYSDSNGNIDWKKLVVFNSLFPVKPPKSLKSPKVQRAQKAAKVIKAHNKGA